MDFEQYAFSLNAICITHNVKRLDHYFSAEALKSTIKRELAEVKYHLSRIQNEKIKSEVSSAIKLYNERSVDKTFMESAMTQHGMMFFGKPCRGCPHVILDILDDLEEDQYEFDFIPPEAPALDGPI